MENNKAGFGHMSDKGISAEVAGAAAVGADTKEVEAQRATEISNGMNTTLDVHAIASAIMDTSSESDADDDILEVLAQISDDEEMLLLKTLGTTERNKRNSILNYLDEVVPTYREEEFRVHFRISRTLYNNLAARFEESDIYRNLREDKRKPAKTYIAVLLWFAGHEACSYRDLSDRFNLALSTVCRIVEKSTMFISSLSPEVIKWPNEEKKIESANFFGRKCGFSKAIGCIDGTHIVIDPPEKCKDDYIDRKGNVTLSLQGICNENRKFINIFVGFPGSCHDSWVFQNSPIYEKLASSCGDYYLLGDSAYPCTQFLITPYKDNGHLTRAQKNFNMKLSSGRVAIEHTFGLLKQRFRQLYYCKLRGCKKLCHFIRACCVLHNIANENDLEFSTEEAIIEENEQQNETTTGNAVREEICRQLQNTTT